MPTKARTGAPSSTTRTWSTRRCSRISCWSRSTWGVARAARAQRHAYLSAPAFHIDVDPARAVPAAVIDERGARRERGFVAGEEERHLRHFFGLAEATQQRHALHRLRIDRYALGLHLLSDLLGHRRHRCARAERVDADLVSSQLHRRTARHGDPAA